MGTTAEEPSSWCEAELPPDPAGWILCHRAVCLFGSFSVAPRFFRFRMSIHHPDWGIQGRCGFSVIQSEWDLETLESVMSQFLRVKAMLQKIQTGQFKQDSFLCDIQEADDPAEDGATSLQATLKGYNFLGPILPPWPGHPKKRPISGGALLALPAGHFQFSLSLTLIHPHSHSHSLSPHSHSLSHSLSRTLTPTPTHSLPFTLTLSLSLSLSVIHSHSHSRPHSDFHSKLPKLQRPGLSHFGDKGLCAVLGPTIP